MFTCSSQAAFTSFFVFAETDSSPWETTKSSEENNMKNSNANPKISSTLEPERRKTRRRMRTRRRVKTRRRRKRRGGGLWDAPVELRVLLR